MNWYIALYVEGVERRFVRACVCVCVCVSEWVSVQYNKYNIPWWFLWKLLTNLPIDKVSIQRVNEADPLAS